VDCIPITQGDEIAIDKARRGDRDAFRLLVDRHARPVFRLAFRMTGNEIDAEDMVQETFLKAWKQIGKFDGRATFGTWLHRICTNCSLDHLRARKRKQELPDGTDPLAQMATGAPSPERLAFELGDHRDSRPGSRRTDRDGARRFRVAALRGPQH
jgi:RNA polymerase sigma-70 factor (ECF subfamily)